VQCWSYFFTRFEQNDWIKTSVNRRISIITRINRRTANISSPTDNKLQTNDSNQIRRKRKEQLFVLSFVSSLILKWVNVIFSCWWYFIIRIVVQIYEWFGRFCMQLELAYEVIFKMFYYYKIGLVEISSSTKLTFIYFFFHLKLENISEN